MTRKQRAIQLRDLTLLAIKTGGAQACADINMAMRERPNDLYIYYRTVPYLPAWVPSRNLPYGLDIWSGNKVLNFEWSDDGRINVISYRPGEWESDLERACCVGNVVASPANLGRDKEVEIAIQGSRDCASTGDERQAQGYRRIPRTIAAP
jgi:hypothetical protein